MTFVAKKDVLIVTPFRSYAGGVETFNHNLCTLLRADGRQVKFVTLALAKRCTRKSCFLKAFAYVFSHQLLLSFLLVSYKPKWRRGRPFIIANGEYGIALRGTNATVFHGSPFAVYRNCFLSSIKPYLSSLRLHIFHLAASRQSLVSIALTSASKRELDSVGIKCDYIIPHCVLSSDGSKVGVSRYKKYVFVGSSDFQRKGMDIIDHISALDSPVDVFCSQRPPYNNLAWKGSVPRAVVSDIVSNYRLLVLPSRFESLPFAVLEAFSRGTPVLISRVGYGVELSEIVPEFVVDISTYRPLPAARAIVEASLLIEANWDHYSRIAFDLYRSEFSSSRFLERWSKVIDR